MGRAVDAGIHIDIDSNRLCRICNRVRSLEFFHNWRRGDSVRRRNVCKDCRKQERLNLKSAKEMAGNPRPPELGHPCQICKDTQRSLLFDHDHATNNHRGWICARCNLVLGQIGDSLEWIASAGEYLSGGKQVQDLD